MRPHNGAIGDDPFQVRVGREMRKQLVPDVALLPTGEPFIDTIPFAIRVRQQAPLSPATGDPEHRFDKAATFEFIPDIEAGTVLKERINALPGLIR
jgi:hypothetical protein